MKRSKWIRGRTGTGKQMTFLKITGICKKSDDNIILDHITFSQKKLQNIAIAGETGAGKSTLLKIIAGLEQPDDGEVVFEGQKVTGPAENLVPGHPGILYLSQHFELQKFLRVEQVLAYSNSLSDEDANVLFDVCRISHLLKRKTNELSGGEKQRIALARLMISSPKLLLLDEPFSNLDRVHKNILRSVINDIGRRLKINCILISHDAEDILSWADQILVMKDGRIIQRGTPEKIYRKPVNEYTAGLFGKYSLLENVLAADFAKAAGFRPGKKKRLIVRPEHFRIVTTKRRGFPAEVEQVNYFGSYREMEISLSGCKLTVRTEEDKIKRGERVFVSLLPGHGWWI